jgi:hypothetical protein
MLITIPGYGYPTLSGTAWYPGASPAGMYEATSPPRTIILNPASGPNVPMTIASGSYQSSTGIVVITITAGVGLTVGGQVTLSGLTGTGANLNSLNGSFITIPTTSGTTITFNAGAGLGSITITGGTIAGGPISDYTSALANWTAVPNSSVYIYVTAVLSGFRTAAAIEADIAAYFIDYPATTISGVYIDNVSDTTQISTLYQPVVSYIVANYPTVKTIVLGTGAIPATNVWLTLTTGPGVTLAMSYENSYSALSSFTPPSWVYNYQSSQFYYFIHDTTLANMPAAAAMVSAANGGQLLVTDGTSGSGNPYEYLPTYWDTFVNIVNGAPCGFTAIVPQELPWHALPTTRVGVQGPNVGSAERRMILIPPQEIPIQHPRPTAFGGVAPYTLVKSATTFVTSASAQTMLNYARNKLILER